MLKKIWINKAIAPGLFNLELSGCEYKLASTLLHSSASEISRAKFHRLTGAPEDFTLKKEMPSKLANFLSPCTELTIDGV